MLQIKIEVLATNLNKKIFHDAIGVSNVLILCYDYRGGYIGSMSDKKIVWFCNDIQGFRFLCDQTKISY